MEPQRLSEGALAAMREGGVWVPSPLALDIDKNMLEDWQRLLTLYYLRSGAHTIIPGAHTGEFAGGDIELYGRWLRLVREMCDEYGGEHTFLMAAVGGEKALKQAELAAKVGFDIVMVAPTAFAGRDDDGVVRVLREIASVIPVFGFELQRAIAGSREFSGGLWSRIFDIAWGAKGASFDTYRAQRMLAAAARSPHVDRLVLATGNDDRIVADLGGVFPFQVEGTERVMSYDAGLCGHFATDTRAAVKWVNAVIRCREDAEWTLPISKETLAHRVNMCNGALFDALNGFQNSVWGVKRRLTALGLLPAPNCFNESGRPGMNEDISRVYSYHPLLNDEEFLAERLSGMKREVGL